MLGGNSPALHPLFVSSETPCPHSGPLPSSARPGEPCAGIQLLQRRWPGISKQGSEGAGAVRGELGGESVITPGSPEITGTCEAAPGRWEANATYKVLKHDGYAEPHWAAQPWGHGGLASLGGRGGNGVDSRHQGV